MLVTKLIVQKYKRFIVALGVVLLVGTIVSLWALRRRYAEPIMVSGRTAYALQFSQNGDLLLGLSTINSHPLLCAWKTSDGTESWRWSFPADENAPFSLAQSPDGKFVAAASSTIEGKPLQNRLRLWEIKTGRVAHTASWSAEEMDGKTVAHGKVAAKPLLASPTSVHYRPDGSILMSYRLIRGRAATTVFKSVNPFSNKPLQPTARFAGDWNVLALSNAGDEVLAADSRQIALLDLDSSKFLWRTQGEAAVTSDFRLITLSRGTSLLQIDRTISRTVWNIPVADLTTLNVQGPYLITTTKNGMAEVREARTGAVREQFEATKDYKNEPAYVDGIALSNDNRTLAAGGHRFEHNHIMIWQLH